MGRCRVGASIQKAILVILFLSTLTACGVGDGDGENPEYIDVAYVTNHYSGAIHGFKISETGELTKIHAYPFSAGDSIIYIAITPNGKFLYTAGGTASVFKIDPSTGSLTWQSNPPLLGEAVSMYIDPSGRFLFDNWSTSGEYVTINGLRVLRINQVNGTLADAAGHGPAYINGSVAFDPEGKFAYMSSGLGFSVYAIDGETGALLETPGSPFPVSYDSGSDPFNVVAVHPESGFIYIASAAGISVFALDAVSGALIETEGSPFASGDSPLTLAIDPSGRFAYAASLPTPTLFAYVIDAATGALSEVEGSPYTLPATARSLAIAPSGRSLYVTIPEANAVRAYAINNDSGALTLIGGSPVQAGTAPYRIATIRIRQGA